MRFILVLFLLISTSGYGKDAEIQFTQTCSKAMNALLHYDFNQAETLLQTIEKKEPNHIALPYLRQYAQFLVYLANDNRSNYEAFIEVHDKAMDDLKSKQKEWYNILSSNMLLQKSLVEMSRNNQFQGALALYRSYSAFRNIQTNPDNILWHLKLRGIFNVLWDRIPDNWRFVTNLAGFQGDFHMGIRQLVGYNDNRLPEGMAEESKIILLYIHKLFQQEEEEGLADLFDEVMMTDNSPITDFLYSGIMSKMGHGKKALDLLQAAPTRSADQFPLLRLLHAKLLLNSNQTKQARIELSQFIKQYRGDSFCNDAYLQMSRICIVEDQHDEAAEWSLKCLARTAPITTTDRQAMSECRRFNQWQPNLLRARLCFDFGDYEKADEWASKPVTASSAKIEQQYRKGRIAHRRGHLQDALEHYNNTIALSSKDARYYAPYAALYCAEIEIAAHNNQKAAKYLATAKKLNIGEYKQELEFKIKNCQKQIE